MYEPFLPVFPVYYIDFVFFFNSVELTAFELQYY